MLNALTNTRAERIERLLSDANTLSLDRLWHASSAHSHALLNTTHRPPRSPRLHSRPPVRFRSALRTDKVSPCVLSCGLPQTLSGKKLDQLLDREAACQRRLIPGVLGIPGELRQRCEDLLRSRRHHGL